MGLDLASQRRVFIHIGTARSPVAWKPAALSLQLDDAAHIIAAFAIEAWRQETERRPHVVAPQRIGASDVVAGRAEAQNDYLESLFRSFDDWVTACKPDRSFDEPACANGLADDDLCELAVRLTSRNSCLGVTEIMTPAADWSWGPVVRNADRGRHPAAKGCRAGWVKNMLTENEKERIAMCQHEGGHVLAAWVAGAPIDHVWVPPLNEQGTFVTPNPGPRARIDVDGLPLHGRIAVALAGAAAQKPTLSLSDFRTDFGAACDALDAQVTACSYFGDEVEVLAGSRQHRVATCLVDRYLHRALVRVDRWLALPQQQEALNQIVLALSFAPRLSGDEVARICESVGVETQSERLLPHAPPCRFRVTGPRSTRRSSP